MWLEVRYRAIIAAEEAKGAGADAARVDSALKSIAGLVRAAAPYRHPRIKPVDHAAKERATDRRIPLGGHARSQA